MDKKRSITQHEAIRMWVGRKEGDWIKSEPVIDNEDKNKADDYDRKRGGCVTRSTRGV